MFQTASTSFANECEAHGWMPCRLPATTRPVNSTPRRPPKLAAAGAGLAGWPAQPAHAVVAAVPLPLELECDALHPAVVHGGVPLGNLHLHHPRLDGVGQHSLQRDGLQGGRQGGGGRLRAGLLVEAAAGERLSQGFCAA